MKAGMEGEGAPGFMDRLVLGKGYYVPDELDYFIAPVTEFEEK